MKEEEVIELSRIQGLLLIRSDSMPMGYFIERFKNDTSINGDYTIVDTYVPFNSGLMNDREFEGTNHSIRIENYVLESLVGNRSLLADSIKVTLFNISRPMYDLFLSLNPHCS